MTTEEIVGAFIGALGIAVILVCCSGLFPPNWRTSKVVIGVALFIPVGLFMLAIGSATPGLLFLFLIMAFGKTTQRKS